MPSTKQLLKSQLLPKKFHPRQLHTPKPLPEKNENETRLCESFIESRLPLSETGDASSSAIAKNDRFLVQDSCLQLADSHRCQFVRDETRVGCIGSTGQDVAAGIATVRTASSRRRRLGWPSKPPTCCRCITSVSRSQFPRSCG